MRRQSICRNLSGFLLRAVSFASLSCLLINQHCQASNAAEFFPLLKNSYWLYKGTVCVCPDGKEKDSTYHVTMKCEVKNVYTTKAAICAEVLGFPDDLWWYTGKTQRTIHAIVRKDHNNYYLLDGDLATQAINLAKHNQPLDKVLNEDAKFIALPLTKDKIYGKEPQAGDDSGAMFAWQVMDAGKSSKARGGRPFYRIIRRYNTDHTIYDLVPGKGVAAVELSHHGTTCDIDLRLVDFHTAI